MTELVIGRGELYFEQFNPETMEGSGERYLGNTPAFSVSREIQVASLYDSYDGMKVEAPGAIISEVHGARFVTDDIAFENLALWYGGAAATIEQTAASAVIETITMIPGRFYQIGATADRPHGYRRTAVTRMRIAGVTVNMADHIAWEHETGRIRTLDNNPSFYMPTPVEIRYDREALTKRYITPVNGDGGLYGSLRFISRAPVGPRDNHFFPLVRITPTGAVDLKGPTWQALTFEVEVRKRSRLHQYSYVERVGS